MNPDTNGNATLEYEAQVERDNFAQMAFRKKWIIGDLFNFCQGAEQSISAESESACCASTISGKFCLYINADNGKSTQSDDLDGTYAVTRPQPCDFGFCTDGRTISLNSPPPPPPYEAPGQPQKPPGPPGFVPDEDYENMFIPASPPPPSPPPGTPTRAVYNEYKQACLEQPSGTIKWEKAIKVQAACSDAKKEVMFGWGMSSCTDYITASASLGQNVSNSSNSSGEALPPGLKIIRECAAIEMLHEMDDPCYDGKSALVKFDGQNISTLAGTSLQCKPKYAMQSWKMLADDRPYYDVLEKPGYGKVGYTCCPLPHSRMCSERSTGCVVKKDGGLESLGSVAARCDVEMDEVMTGWKMSTDNCEDSMMEIISSCCSAEPPLTADAVSLQKDCKGDENNTMCTVFDASALEDKTIIHDLKVPVQHVSPRFELGKSMSGPLIDAVIIEEGASAMSRKEAANENSLSWPMGAFKSAPPQLPNADGNCRYGTKATANGLGNLAAATFMCNQHADVPKGNVFGRIGSTFGIGFYGVWTFKVKTHAFKGALVLTKRGPLGNAVVANKPFQIGDEAHTWPNRKKARFTAELSPGAYTLWVYGAYSNSGEVEAKQAAADDNPDRVMFAQKSHCGGSYLVSFTPEELELCGGNEERADDGSRLSSGDSASTRRSSVAQEEEEPEETVEITEMLPAAHPKNAKVEFNGAYVDFLVMDANGKKDFHLKAQGTIVFFSLTVTFDVFVSPFESGTMYMKFSLLWQMGSIKLGFVSAEVIVDGLDFNALLGGTDFSSLLDLTVELIIVVQPDVLNIMIVPVEALIKVILFPIMWAVLIAIMAIQILLDVLQKVFDLVEKVLKKLQAKLDQVKDRVLKKAQEKQSQLSLMVRQENEMEYQLKPPCKWRKRWCTKNVKTTSEAGCVLVDGVKKCRYNLVNVGELPANCKAYVRRSCQLYIQFWSACCTFRKRIKRMILNIAIAVLLAVAYVVIGIFQAIIDIAMIAVSLAKAAVDAMKQGIIDLFTALEANYGDMKDVLDDNNRVRLAPFNRWLFWLKLIRIHEVRVAAKLGTTQMALELDLDFTLFGARIQIHISFSVSIKAIIKDLGAKCKEIVMGKGASSASTATSTLGAAAGTKALIPAEGECGTAFSKARTSTSKGYRHGDAFDLLDLATSDEHEMSSSEASIYELKRHIAAEHEHHHNLGASVLAAIEMHSAVPSRTRHLASDADLSVSNALFEESSGAFARHVAAALDVPAGSDGLRDALNVAQKAAPLGAAESNLGACDIAALNKADAAATSDACRAAAGVASVSCPLLTHHPRDGESSVGARARQKAGEACAHSASILKNGEACRAMDVCASAALSSLPCTATCKQAVVDVGASCGAYAPRFAHASDDLLRSDGCASAIASAQTVCTEQQTNRFCADLLEAVPTSLKEDVYARSGGRHDAAELGKRRVMLFWDRQDAAGIVPSVMCSIHNGEVDLSGNRLGGSIPGCFTEGARGVSKLRMSNNRLTGSIPALGRHHVNVMLQDNLLSGDLGEAVQAGSNVKHIDVSSNKLHGNLADVVRVLPNVESMDVEGNVGIRGLQSAVDAIASHRNLRHYAIGRVDEDAPALGVQKPRPHVGIHASVMLASVEAQSFCPKCAAAVASGECAASSECRGGEGHDHASAGGALADVLECSVAAVAAHALGVDPADVTAYIVRLTPQQVETREVVTVVTFDVSLPHPWNGRGNEAAAAVSKMLKSTQGGSFADHASSVAFSRCSNVARVRSVGVVRLAEARPACPTGTSGADCRHFCAATWYRSAPLHDAMLHGHSWNRASSIEQDYEDDAFDSSASGRLGSSSTPAVVALKGAKAGAKKRTAAARGIQHAYVGPLAHDDASLTMGAHHIQHCSFRCRAKTLSAVIACDDWTHGFASAGEEASAPRAACLSKMNLMLDPTVLSGVEDVCHVCGVHAHFGRFGLFAGERHYSTSTLGDVLEEEKFHAGVIASSAQDDANFEAWLKSAESDNSVWEREMQTARLGMREVLVREAGMTEEAADKHMDAHIPHSSKLRESLSDFDASHHRAFQGAYSADNVHSGPPSLQSIMRASFPHCKSPVSTCSPACSDAVDVAHAACEGWTRGDLSHKAAHEECASAERKSRQACTVTPAEDSLCHESSLGSYVELLKNGGVYHPHAKRDPSVVEIHSHSSKKSISSGHKFRYSRASVGQVEQSFGLCMAKTGTSMDGQSVECGDGQLMAGFKYSSMMCPEGQISPETNCVEQDNADVTKGECVSFSTSTKVTGSDSAIKKLSSHLVSCPSGKGLSDFKYSLKEGKVTEHISFLSTSLVFSLV
jgi:hypothetical protein